MQLLRNQSRSCELPSASRHIFVFVIPLPAQNSDALHSVIALHVRHKMLQRQQVKQNISNHLLAICIPTLMQAFVTMLNEDIVAVAAFADRVPPLSCVLCTSFRDLTRAGVCPVRAAAADAACQRHPTAQSTSPFLSHIRALVNISRFQVLHQPRNRFDAKDALKAFAHSDCQRVQVALCYLRCRVGCSLSCSFRFKNCIG